MVDFLGKKENTTINIDGNITIKSQDQDELVLFSLFILETKCQVSIFSNV
jgi:hypothetical protein